MKTKISYYVALSVVTLGAMAAVVLSNNGSQGDNNFKNNGEVIYLNKQNLVGEAVGESTLKFDSSKMFAFYDKTKDSKESLRFAVAVKGEIDSINYTRAAIGSYEEQVESITKVYRGLEVEGKTFYYDGATLTTNESAQGKYYWAVYNITYADTVSVKEDDVVSMELTINGETTSFSSSLTQSKLGGGDGSETNPYLIYSQVGWNKYVKDANANAKNFSKKYISLVTSSITSETMIKEFYGNFDGHNNKINVQITESVSNKIGTGLFSVNRGGIIENLVVEGSVDGVINTAGIAGINDGTIRNCVNYASIVNNGSRAGGITAYSRQGSSVINCDNHGSISGGSVDNDGSTDTNKMRGVGGVIGTIHNNSTNAVNIKIENCNNFGTVHNDYQSVGGIAGLILSNAHKTPLTGELTIKNCTNSGEISSGKSFVGGIIGVMNNVSIIIDNCKNLEGGNVTGTCFVGGIVGAFGYSTAVADLKTNTTISNCSNAANITATAEHTGGGYRVGGITGMAYGTAVKLCTNSGTITGGDNKALDPNGTSTNKYVGTLVGFKTGKATIE